MQQTVILLLFLNPFIRYIFNPKKRFQSEGNSVIDFQPERGKENFPFFCFYAEISFL